MEPLVAIKIDGSPRVHLPREVLAGEVQLAAVAPHEVQSLEISVLWFTEGKGDEDLGVHYFVRHVADRAAPEALCE
jgi:hypothetical protein